MWNAVFQIRWLSQMSFFFLLTTGILVGTFGFWQKSREEHFDEAEVIDAVLVSLVWGFIGARLLYILINFETFGLNLWYWLAVWSKPGFHWIGLFGGGFLAFIRFARKQKWEVLAILDFGVIGLAFSQALIQFGIFMSGGGVGHATNLPVGVRFPDTFQAHHPIGLYGLISWFLVGIFLWWLETKYRRFIWYQKYKGDALPGFVFFTYLILFGVIGGLLSLLSNNPLTLYGLNLDVSLRLIIAITGVVGLVTKSSFGTKLGLDNLTWLRK